MNQTHLECVTLYRTDDNFSNNSMVLKERETVIEETQETKQPKSFCGLRFNPELDQPFTKPSLKQLGKLGIRWY